MAFEESPDKNIGDALLLDSKLEPDDVMAILIYIGEVFELSGKISFIVSGFGQEKWPVDCKTDLVTVIKSIPVILKKMGEGIFSFKLDFYEQGIERQLVFEEETGAVRVTCISRTSWLPNPDTIFMSKIEVITMIESFYSNFLDFSSLLCRDLVENSLFKEWKCV